MTITLSWWVLPAGLVGAAFLLVRHGNRKPRGDYDFVTGLYEYAAAGMCIAAAAGIAIGRLL